MEIRIEKLTADTFENLAAFYPWPARFWIRSNFVQTLNGKVTDPSKLLFLASTADKEIFRYLRTTADCVIVGAHTAISQPYQKVKPTIKYLPLRENQDPTKVAIVSNSLNISLDYLSGFLTAPIIFTNQKALDSNAEIKKYAQIVVLGEESVDLENLKPAFSSLGMNRILCEGGATLHTNLVNHDLLDEMNLTIANQFGAANQANLLSAGLDISHHDKFEFNQVLFDEKNLFLRVLKK
jgi:riboflavin biosynthesis pyrimidine reductase